MMYPNLIKLFRFSIFTPLLFAVAACGGGSDSGDKFVSTQEGGGACSAFNARTLKTDHTKVLNGETCSATARTPVIAIVPVLRSGDPAGICTGTLVTVNDFVTSAHCFLQPYLNHGDNIIAFIAAVGGEDGEVIEISNFALHPDYNGEAGSRYDVAMGTLSRVPSPRIGPAPILLSKATLPGQRMSTFGYGRNNEGSIAVLKSAELLIEDIIDGNLIASIVNDDASICGGDSGGPVVQIVDGITTIVGVNSFGYFPLGECPRNPALFSGFVDLQHGPTLEFIGNYAPDVPVI